MSTLPIEVGYELYEALEDEEFTPQEAQQITIGVWESLIGGLMFAVMIKMVNKFIKEEHQ